MPKRIALIAVATTFLETRLAVPPLGLLYLGAQLEAQGHTTQLVDLNADLLPADGDFDQIWISATAPQRAEVVKIAEATKDWTKTKRILGGPSVWANPDNYKDLAYDLIVGGEADHPDNVRQIVALADSKPADNYIFFPTSKTLDWVLPPLRRWNLRYHSYMLDREGNTHRCSTIFPARGCIMGCAFCESSRFGVIFSNRVRDEPIEVVEQQLRECVEAGFSGILNYEDIGVLNRKRTAEMMTLYRKYNLVWRAFVRSDILHKYGEEYFKSLVSGGLAEMFIGVESADNAIKAGIHKGNVVANDEQVLEWARRYNVRVKCSFILGLPGESLESMQKTRDWIFKHRPDRVQVGRLIVFPGTPLGDHTEQFDLKVEHTVDDDWFYAGNNGLGTRSFVSTSHLSVTAIDNFWHTLMADLKSEGIPS